MEYLVSSTFILAKGEEKEEVEGAEKGNHGESTASFSSGVLCRGLKAQSDGFHIIRRCNIIELTRFLKLFLRNVREGD